MLERNIVIIDDNPRIEELYIPTYLEKINQLKKSNPKWSSYEFHIKHCAGMRRALDYLDNPNNIIDVLVVDYDFSTESHKPFSNGTVFVDHVRKNINRNCEIIFYTMQALGDIQLEDWVSLVNSDVFQFVDKSVDDSVLADAIFHAATRRNPVVESLERFMIKYGALLETYTYTFDGHTITFEEIINHIRMDDELGRMFVEKLLQKAILINTEI